MDQFVRDVQCFNLFGMALAFGNLTGRNRQLRHRHRWEDKIKNYVELNSVQ
jgi:hypothetical protein